MDEDASGASGDREDCEGAARAGLGAPSVRPEKGRNRVSAETSRMAGARDKKWKELLANPLTLAIVGGFITVMSTIISNHLAGSANVELETTKAQLAVKAETAKTEAAAQAAQQALQADLIKKFVESPKTQTVRENLKFLVDAGLLPDYAVRITAYLKNNPDAAPQVGDTFEPRLPVIGGTRSSSAAWPWLVGLKLTGDPVATPFCQGTVIGPHAVLTAAHCVARFNGPTTGISIVTANAEGIKKECRLRRLLCIPRSRWFQYRGTTSLFWT